MLQLSFVNFKKGSFIIVEEKMLDDRFYIIQSGKVKISHNIEIPGMTTETLGPGDFIGAIACMSRKPHMESALAVEDTVCIAVKREQYPELIQKNTPVAMKVIRTFSKRMRELNDAIMMQTASDNAEAKPEQIFRVAEYYDNDGQGSIAAFAYYQYLKVQKDGPLAEKAKARFAHLRKTSEAVYFEPTPEPIRKYPMNTMIFSEAQSGAEMFIIQSGSVKISKVINESSASDGREVILTILKKGDMFGEMALLENKPRSASAIATEDCVLMTINKHNFNQMVTTQPDMIAHLTTTFAQRLWPMQRQLTNSLFDDPVRKMFDMLSLQLEKSKMSELVNFQTNYSPTDIATMCGLAKEDQARPIRMFTSSHLISVVKNKILIKDCNELIEQALFYRNMLARTLNGQ